MGLTIPSKKFDRSHPVTDAKDIGWPLETLTRWLPHYHTKGNYFTIHISRDLQKWSSISSGQFTQTISDSLTTNVTLIFKVREIIFFRRQNILWGISRYKKVSSPSSSGEREGERERAWARAWARARARARARKRKGKGKSKREQKCGRLYF